MFSMKLKIILIFILLAAIAVSSVFLFAPETLQIKKMFSSKNTTVSKHNEFDSGLTHAAILEHQLMKQLQNLEVTEKNIRRKVLNEDSTIEIRASIPRGRPMEWVVWMITAQLNQTCYKIDDCYYDNDEEGCRILFSCKESGNPDIILILMQSAVYFSHTAKIAIFIEDFGFQADQTTIEYLSFKEPLTIGLIPEKKMTTWTAQIANEYHKEIVLMLPMEPMPLHLSKQSGPLLMVHYTDDKIHSLIADAMDKIPHFSGITNYYGARVLADSRVMSILLNDAAEKNVYFLYDQQSRSSAVDMVAKKENIIYKSIDMHIDTNSTSGELQDTLRRCAVIAQKTGEVIVSSRPTSAFINALQNELPVLRKNGIKLVYISDLVRKKDENRN